MKKKDTNRVASMIVMVLIAVVVALITFTLEEKTVVDDGEESAAITTENTTENSTENDGEGEQTHNHLTIKGDVETEIVTEKQEKADADEESLYNGEELADNGQPYAIKVNRQENIVTVYSLDEDGFYTVPVRVMRCSVAPGETTTAGVFTTSMKWDWLALFGNVDGQYVTQIVGDILFHTVPYEKMTKDSLETWEFNKLGTHASMGCVRMCVADTKWVYDNCDPGTYVNIFDSDYYGPLGMPQNPYIFDNTEETDWDPTDMDEENPYAKKLALFGVRSHEIKVGEPFDDMAGVFAFDSDMEDVTSQISVEGEVDNTTEGIYKLTYSVKDANAEISEEIEITVTDDEAPIINSAPKTVDVVYYSGEKLELARLINEHVKAYSGDEEITEFSLEGIENEDPCIYYNMDQVKGEAGVYTVSCYIRDVLGNESEKYEFEVRVEQE